MDKEKTEQIGLFVQQTVKKYKYVILVLFAGFILLSLGAGKEKADVSAARENVAAAQETAAFDLAAFEQRLEQSLGQISGAGRIKLTLSLSATEESVYAADIRRAQQNADNSSYESALSTSSSGSYGEQPILVKNLYPTFRGALVLCDGAGQDAVRLAVTQAVSAVCGLGTDKISVLKMQG